MNTEIASSDVDSQLEWDRLRSYLRAETAPLALIEVESEDQAEEVLEAIRHECQTLEVYRPVEDAEEPHRVLDWLDSRKASASPEAVFLILGLDRFTPDKRGARAFWSWMNLQRERWRTPVGKVAFVLTPPEVDYLCRYAAALWDWILLKFNFLRAWSILRIQFMSEGDIRASATRLGEPTLDSYRAWAQERHRGISLLGAGGGDVQLSLEEIFVPLRTAHRAEITDMKPESFDIELDEIFTTSRAPGRHVVVLGDPGAGKTTVLRKLHQQTLNAGPASLGLAEGTLPVFLPLRHLREDDLDISLGDVLGREMHELSGGLLDADVGRRLWRRGRLLLLLDGLDEIADDERRARFCRYLEWQLAASAQRDLRAVVSCRYAGYGGRVKLQAGFLHLDVRPLDGEQCRRLVRMWFREIPRALPGYSEHEAREAAERLLTALEGSDYGSQRLKVLVGSPLLLTLLCTVVLRGGEMPKQRVAFYEQCLRVLLSQWGRSKLAADEIWGPPLDVETALAVLRSLAYDLHSRNRREEMSLRELVRHVEVRLEQLDLERPAHRIVRWLHREAGVLEEHALHHYRFLHLGVQEYLAALHIASQGEDLLDELCHGVEDPWWHEVLLLAVALPGRRILAPLMERLLRSPVLLERTDLVRACLDEASDVDVEPLLEWLDPGREPARQAAVLRLLRGRSNPRLEARVNALTASAHGTVQALARQMIAEQIGRTSAAVEQTEQDPGMGLVVSGQPFTEPVTGTRFLWIPGGRFSMGSSRNESERPVHWVRISPFWLAETPVTNRQYALFLERTEHEEPTLWRDRRFSAPEQPVVGVSWHDAMACCRWLSQACDLPVTLPSEAQWEYSARGPDSLEYPWGAELPDASRACFGMDRDEGRPSVVGSFPAGRGPLGTVDLAGNVWEWCRDSWDSSAYKGRGSGEIIDPWVLSEGSPSKVLRGGGWWDAPEYLRSAGRFWGPASLRNGGIGFRLAVVPRVSHGL